MEVIGVILALFGILLAIIFWLFPPPKPPKDDDKSHVEDKPYYELIEKAESGDDTAQCELGIMYMTGDRIPRDYDTGIVWLRKAVAQNNLHAMNYLGISYTDGSGVEIDKKEAFKLYKKAAEQGYADAQFNLGLAYLNGLGVVPDDKEALLWLKKAADQGLLEADDLIADLVKMGYGYGDQCL